MKLMIVNQLEYEFVILWSVYNSDENDELKPNSTGRYEHHLDVYDDIKEKLCNEMNDIYNLSWQFCSNFQYLPTVTHPILI